MLKTTKDLFIIVLAIALLLTPFIAWLTHVITCIQTEKWLFLLAGAIMFPIGILHGIGLWFGVF